MLGSDAVCSIGYPSSSYKEPMGKQQLIQRLRAEPVRPQKPEPKSNQGNSIHSFPIFYSLENKAVSQNGPYFVCSGKWLDFVIISSIGSDFATLVVLDLAQERRLALNSEFYLPLPTSAGLKVDYSYKENEKDNDNPSSSFISMALSNGLTKSNLG
ncbi:hypothetical protein STEG23_000044, partial [Scotinomys teguina]